MGAAIPVMLILLAVIAVPVAIIALIYLIVPVIKAIAWVVRQVVRFIFGVVSDMLRAIGAVITMVALVPLVIGNVALGRWSASAHFGRAIQGEAHAALRCVYRVFIGHPARLLCLTSLTDGLEKRIPEAVAAAPGRDTPGGKANQFDGYTIVGSLPGGGSGSKLYVADPSRQKLAAFERGGTPDVDQVVIKCFSLREGSSLPQIVRESRALDAAKRLGLILEHALNADRFYYVMKYVPGDSLGLVTQRLHAASTSDGLGDRELRETLEYGADLLRTLCHYHTGGLWHKDVKPDNIIVAHGQAHLVDFGLVTPLRSAMTLTTHGTEYFRDPEMVRRALKGVKVHEVDGAKFDLYAAGAVLYSVVENSFPAHGGLSQISKRCPEALRWIVRRAMTDYDKRYESAAAMLADVEAVLASNNMHAFKPAMLPSFGGSIGDQENLAEAASPGFYDGGGHVGAAVGAGAGVGVGAPHAPHVAPAAFAGHAGVRAGSPRPAERIKPRIRVTSWWSGGYHVDGKPAAPARDGAPTAAPKPAPAPPFVRRSSNAKAADQLRSARERVASARARANDRMRQRNHKHASGINGGVAAALFAFLAVAVALGALIMAFASEDSGPKATVVVERSERAAGRLADAAEEFAAKARELDSRTRGTRATPPPPPPPVEPGSMGQILVLREPFTLGTEHAVQVNGQLARLREAGFELIGSSDVPAADTQEQSRQDILVADLRAAVGVVPFLSSEAAERIRRWLRGHEELPIVLWIGRGEGDQPQVWVVGRERVDPQLPARAHAALTVKQAR